MGRIKKMASETCSEEGMVAKEEVSGWKNTKVRGGKTDIRNWFKKKEQVKEENIYKVEFEEDMVLEEGIIDPTEEIIDLTEEIIDLTEEITPLENKEDEVAIIELKKFETASSRRGKVKEKVDIRRGPGEEFLINRLDLRRWDFQSLSGTRYLNDRIIDMYLKLIRERNEADSMLPKIYTCITHLYTATV